MATNKDFKVKNGLNVSNTTTLRANDASYTGGALLILDSTGSTTAAITNNGSGLYLSKDTVGTVAAISLLSTGINLMGNVITTGTIQTKAPTISSLITGATSGSIEVPVVSGISSPTHATFLHQTTVLNTGYVQHVSLGSYRSAVNGWDSFYIGIGGNDAYPTNKFSFGFDGSLIHSGTGTFLNASNYNTLAPSLTGVGASGTWSINTNGAHNGTVGATAPNTGVFTTINTNGNVTIGTSASINSLYINGTGSGTGGGAASVVQNNGTPVIAIGNKSALIGGTYSATPMLYGATTIETNVGLTVGGVITTGISAASTVTAILTKNQYDPNFQLSSKSGDNLGVTGSEMARFGLNYNNAWDSFTQYLRGTSSQNGSQVLWAGNVAVATVAPTGVSITGEVNITDKIVIKKSGGFIDFRQTDNSRTGYIQETAGALAIVGERAGSVVDTWANGVKVTTVSSTGLTVIGDVKATSFYDPTITRITNPGGGSYVTGIASVTGALKIVLPVGMTSTMIRMTIKVYEYNSSGSFEINCGGYNYPTGNTWANNPFAYIINTPGVNRNYNVRFGYTAGGKAVIYIGELNTVWNYPQVFVTDVQLGYGGYGTPFASGWIVGVEPTAFENVTATIINPQVSLASTVAGSALGTAAVGTALAYARADHVHQIPANVVAAGAAGFMTGADKTKLDGIATGATNYTHPANHAPSIITQDASNRFVTDAEKTTWNAKQSALGFNPVQQGTGTNQGSSVIKMGWGTGPNTGKVALTIDSTDFGYTWPININGGASMLTNSRTINRTAFNGTANIECTEWFHSGRDFPLGTTIYTDINYANTEGDPFVLEIKGNSYGNLKPFDIQYQGYIYSNSVINHGGISNGTNIPGLVLLNVGGLLTFWFPTMGYWQGFNVRVYRATLSGSYNAVTSIVNSAKPTGTKEVALSANIVQSWHSGNLTISGVNTGDQTTITGNAGSATILQTARTINGVSFNGSANITINAVDSTARIASSEKGAANGVATLDGSGLIPTGQLPSYVDDVLEYANLAALPGTGVAGKIYVALDTNKTYRWGGSSYVYITSGAVDSVAGKTGIVSLVKADVGLGLVDNTADASKSVSYAATAGSTNNIDGVGFVNGNSSIPTNADTITSNGISYYNGGVPDFTGNAVDGALYTQTHTPGTWEHQIAGDYRSGQIALRGKNNGTWQAWRTVWDKTNLTNLSQLNNNTGFITSSGSITGNAGTVTNATFINQFTVRCDRSDGNNYSLPARPTGIYAIAGAGTNGPGASYLNLIHVTNATDVAFQIAGGYNSDSMFFRGTADLANGVGYTPWRSVIHSGNVGSQSVNYAATAGSAGILTGPASVNGTDGWFRSSGATGWYNGTYSVGIYATEVGNIRTYNGANFISSGTVSGTNLSGTNTGDETLATIKTKLGIATLSGANTGDQTNITGSAGSAARLSEQTAYTMLHATLPTATPMGATVTFVGPAVGEGTWPNYGSLVNIRSYAGGGGTMQMLAPYGVSQGGTGLKIRFGDYDTNGGNAWTAWKTVWDSVNLTNLNQLTNGPGYITSAGSISGTAAYATAISGVASQIGYSTSAVAIAYTSTGGPQIMGQSTGAAMLSFHRPGAYAINFGLDTDNVLKVGGWSAGAVSYKIWHEGNDGAGSGLDADLLDGQSSAYYAPISAPSFTSTITVAGVVTANAGITEKKSALGALNIDLSLSTYFSKTISATSTLTVSNVPASGNVGSFILDLTNGGAYAITWWSGMKWAGGTAPTLTASGRDVLAFFTHDGGTTWNGLVLAKDIK